MTFRGPKRKLGTVTCRVLQDSEGFRDAVGAIITSASSSHRANFETQQPHIVTFNTQRRRLGQNFQVWHLVLISDCESCCSSKCRGGWCCSSKCCGGWNVTCSNVCQYLGASGSVVSDCSKFMSGVASTDDGNSLFCLKSGSTDRNWQNCC